MCPGWSGSPKASRNYEMPAPLPRAADMPTSGLAPAASTRAAVPSFQKPSTPCLHGTAPRRPAKPTCPMSSQDTTSRRCSRPQGCELDQSPEPGALVRFHKSVWFTRGWTLQELIAPSEVGFFAHDWSPIGTRSRMARIITKACQVYAYALTAGVDLNWVSVARKMY